MLRRALFALLACAAVVLPGTAPPADAQQTRTLRIATLAPRGTPLIKALKQWDRLLRKQSDGRVRLRIYAGGSAGDEKVVVRKMRAGQLDGGIVTVTGLGFIARQSLVLAAPGVIRDYDQLDRVRKAMEDDFDRIFENQGYVLMGWGDAGRTRLFSKKRIVRPRDLKSARPWVWTDNPVMVEFVRTIGANGVRLGVPEVYPGLQTGMIDTVTASALTAVGLQWFTRLDYVTEETSGVIVGAMVIRKDKFDALDQKDRELIRVTSRIGNDEMRDGARRMDTRAYRALVSRGIERVKVGKYQSEWEAVAKKTRDKLAGRLYPKSLLRRVQRLAGRGG
ncbi:MAG: TRAP transporter substrate-binding protein DctP [Myxococcota bacterium]